MLSEEEKREMKTLAQSDQLREEFRMLRRLTQQRPMTPDQFIVSATAVNLLAPPVRRCRFVAYTNIRL